MEVSRIQNQNSLNINELPDPCLQNILARVGTAVEGVCQQWDNVRKMTAKLLDFARDELKVEIQSGDTVIKTWEEHKDSILQAAREHETEVFARAARKGNIEVIKWLLNENFVEEADCRIGVEASVRLTFWDAACSGQKEIVELLLDKKVVGRQDAEVDLAFQSAVEHGHMAIVKLLLDRGLINQQDLEVIVAPVA